VNLLSGLTDVSLILDAAVIAGSAVMISAALRH
jgi:hypothetical protein